MKKLVVMLMFLSLQSLMAQEHHDLNWLTDFKQAQAIAQKEHKPIVMLFTGSDWCPPCRAMHNELFVNKDFKKLSKKVVLVMVDFPRRKPMSKEQRRKNQELARKYHHGGVPTFVALTPDGEVINKISGYMYGHPERDLEFFKNVIVAVKKK